MNGYPAALLVILCALLAGCSSSTSDNQKITDLEATIQALAARTPQTVLVTPSPAQTAQRFHLIGTVTAPACYGGYGIGGANVTVKNERGEVIATSTASGCTAPTDSFGPGGAVLQRVTFDLDVPKTAFYQLAIGAHDAPTYSFDELQQMNWNVALSLH